MTDIDELFKNDIITVKELEVIPEYERVYKDDNVYREDYINFFLQELPVDLHNNKFIQERIELQTNSLLDMIHKSKTITDDYPLKHQFKQNQFAAARKFIIPVVLDQQVIYSKIEQKISNEELAENIDKQNKNEDQINTDAIHYENLITQLKRTDEYNIQYAKSEIDLERYMINTHKLTMPYLIHGNNYRVSLRNNTELIRKTDIDTAHWKKRVGLAPFEIPFDILDDNKRVKSVGKRTVINGEEVNIVGFLFINTEQDSSATGKNNLIGNITHLDISDETTILTIPNHGLETGDIVIIHGNPALDGVFEDIERIDENKIGIRFDSTKLTNFEGRIYGIPKLKYKTVKITRDFSNIVEKEFDENVLYLFENTDTKATEITKEEFPKLIDAIFPSYMEITQHNVISKYMLSLSEIPADAFQPIKDRLKQAIETETKLAAKPFHPPKIKPVDDYKDTIYNDANFYDAEIVGKYGKYPLQDTVYDRLEKRINWINLQRDYGSYYYNFIISKKTPDYKNLLRDVKKYYETLQKTFEKERKVNSFYDKCIKYVAEFRDMEQMGKDKTVFVEGDVAIVIKERKLYKWSKAKTKWEFLKNVDDISNLPCLCKLNGFDVADLKEISCEFSQLGCRSKKIVRNELRLKSADESFKDLSKLVENQKSDASAILENMLLLSQFWKPMLTTRKEPEQVVEITKEIPDELTVIMNALNRIYDRNIQKYIIYKLIDLDGILIKNWIYSKKFGVGLICGHYSFMKRIDYTSNNNIKNLLTEQMYNFYGVINNGFYVCKSCGGILGKIEFDEAAGFDDRGNPIRTSEKWIDEKKEIRERMHRRGADEFSCNSLEFENELRLLGLTNEQINSAISYCDIVASLAKQLNVSIDKLGYIDVLGDIITEQIPSLNDCKKFYFTKFKSSGKSMDVIKRLDEQGEFAALCQKLIQLKRVSLVAARFVIYIETSVPDIHLGRIKSNCSIGEDLTKFIGCLVGERKMISVKRKDGKTQFANEEEIVGEMSKWIEKLKRKGKIRKLYEIRRAYDAQKEPESKRDDVPKRQELEWVAPEIGKLKEEGYTYAELFQRNVYVNQQIKAILQKAVGEFIEKNPNMVANGCCLYSVKDGYLMANEETKTGAFVDYMTDAKTLQQDFDNRVISGSMTRGEIPFVRINYTDNHPVFNIVDDIIIEKEFAAYCPTGELHSFVGDVCVKCGYDKIAAATATNPEKKHTKEQYEELVDKIGKKSLELAKKSEEESSELGMKLKSASSDIEKMIDQFVNKLSKIVGKDVKAKYGQFLRELGNYVNVYSDAEQTNKEPRLVITLINKREENRIALLKTYINQYFRKFVSMIAHYDDVNKIQERLPEMMCDFTKDVQKCVIDDYIVIGQFMNPANIELFDSLKFQYTIGEVNSLTGKSDVYNCAWDKVIKESKFSVANASEVLLYILIKVLSDFLDNGSSAKKKEQVIIGNFITTVFDMILADDSIFNMEQVEFARYKNLIYQTQYDTYSKILTQKSVAELELMKLDYKEAEGEEITIDNIIEKEAENEQRKKSAEQSEEELETAARDKLGKDASEAEIEAFKTEWRKERKAEKQKMKDHYNIEQAEEGDEILETGDDYSELPQGEVEEF